MGALFSGVMSQHQFSELNFFTLLSSWENVFQMVVKTLWDQLKVAFTYPLKGECWVMPVR
jgi:hypothetical protein